MTSAKDLSIEFLSSHPETAVPVLEGIKPAAAAAYLEDVPSSIGAATLEAMQPLVVSAILPMLPARTAANMLRVMDIHASARILRLVDSRTMQSITDALPKTAARQLARIVGFPEGTVGAWMSSDVVTIDRSMTAHACLAVLRSLPKKARNPLFVIEAGNRFYGVLDLADLLAAPDDVAIEEIADVTVKNLSPYARLQGVVALDAWAAALSLPVVDSRRRFVGALHFDRLRQGLAADDPTDDDKSIGLIMAHMAEAFLVCATGVVEGAAPRPEASRPLPASENRNG